MATKGDKPEIRGARRLLQIHHHRHRIRRRRWRQHLPRSAAAAAARHHPPASSKAVPPVPAASIEAAGGLACSLAKGERTFFKTFAHYICNGDDFYGNTSKLVRNLFCLEGGTSFANSSNVDFREDLHTKTADSKK